LPFFGVSTLLAGYAAAEEGFPLAVAGFIIVVAILTIHSLPQWSSR